MATYNGQVTGGGLNLRASASTNSSRLVQIPNNTQIVVSDYSGNSEWYCTTYSGQSGFVMKQYVNILGNVAFRSCAVTGGGLNLRAYPSTSAPSPVQIPNGTALTVQTHNSTWSSTTYNGNSGFVMSQYLTDGGGTVDPPTPTTGMFYGRVTVTSGTLNVRNAPGGGTIIGSLPNNRILICEDIGNSSWYRTHYKGNDAYVSTSYITRITSPAVHSTYVQRCMYIYPPEIGRSNPAYFDNASGQWCQLFVNWLLRASYMPSNRVPTTASTGEGIQFWVRNTTFYFKSATWKGPLNTRYSLGVGSALTTAEQNYTPVPGDVIYFRWDGLDSSVYVSHTGIVTSVSNGYVHTIEGNKSKAVGERSISLTNSQIVGYGKPDYSM